MDTWVDGSRIADSKPMVRSCVRRWILALAVLILAGLFFVATVAGEPGTTKAPADDLLGGLPEIGLPPEPQLGDGVQLRGERQTSASTLAVISTGVCISPSVASLSVGMTTTVGIWISNVVNLFGAEIYLQFDPTRLQVVDSEPGPGAPGVQIEGNGFLPPDYTPRNGVNNQTGYIEYVVSRTTPIPAVSGSGVLAWITFEGIATGAASVNITSTLLADASGLSIPVTICSGTYVDVTTEYMLSGWVSFEGRSLLPGPEWVSPLTVTLSAPGNPVPAYVYPAITNESAFFVVTGFIAPGTYDIKVRDHHSLENLRASVAVAPGMPSLQMGELIEVDNDCDNDIDVADLAILAVAYTCCDTDPCYDPRADFNEDGCIGVQDLALLAAHYTLTGPIVLAP